MGDLVNMSGFDYDFYEDEFDEEPEYGGNTEEEEEDVIILDDENDDVEVVDDVNMERDNLSQRNFAADHIHHENNGYFHDDDFGYTPRRPRTPQNVPRISREETEFAMTGRIPAAIENGMLEAFRIFAAPFFSVLDSRGAIKGLSCFCQNALTV